VNAIFVGEKRSGKTTLAFHVALNPTRYDAGLHNAGGVIVFDPKKEFRGWPATVSSVAEMEKFIKQGHRVIIWRPPSEDENEDERVGDKPMQDSFNQLARWIIRKHDFALAQGWDKKGFYFTFLVDEAYNVQSHAWINKRLLRILSQCRPEILNVFQTFQSVKNVNSDSRSRVSDWFVFTITLPADLKRLEEFAMPEVIEQARTLPEHEYVHFLNEKGKVASEVVSDSDGWYESLDYEGKKGGFMEREEKDDRDEFPKDGITILDRGGLDEAHRKYNRRVKDDPGTKYRQRSSDNQRDSKKRDGGNSKTLTFGKKTA
jgi:hypothetical protein